MKIISLFNHKGGVSKTTTTFNLGWMLAEKGYKTMIVDADPQCNLTALVMNYDNVSDAQEFYTNNPRCTLAEGLEPVMKGRPEGLSLGMPIQTINDKLYMYCGSLALSEYETQMSVALTTSTAIPAIRNIPGSANELLRRMGEEHELDYILIDMSPSVGALNMCLLMSSDYFIVPTSPDFFCSQAIDSLSRILPDWDTKARAFRDSSLDMKFPDSPPKFIGFISQRYRPRDGAPAKSFQQWIDTIKRDVQTKLIPALSPCGMAISIEDFESSVSSCEPYNLSNIADFNSLIAQSQKHNVPVFALSDRQIEQTGTILNKMKENRESFRNVFSILADSVVELTEK
ncbi:AAA family ATPase [Vibrio sp.]|uniref:ParA family protein n=1 Tax=Vibrio sp. TaxID=678 RepID=UPI00311EE84B